MFKRILYLVVLLATSGCLVQHIQAQSLNGLLTGAITDANGAIVPGVQVTAVNLTTGESRTASTNNLGIWLIPQLPPGMYRVTAAGQGFATVVQSNIQLDVNQSVTINFTLQVAASSETIQVTTAPPLLNTTSATISTIVNHQEVVDLPLNGRQFSQLALLSPGEAPKQGYQQGLFAVPEGGGGMSPATDGQRGQSNNYTIDGIENNELFANTWAIAPPPDALEEFAVQSHMTDAQFGVSSGANINIQTRPGTNSFHGDAWEFVRNNDFAALQYPNSPAQNPFYHQNQYGFFVGGPVIHNRTFFSAYWEGYRFSQASAVISSTLTKNERAGNFSGEVGTTQIGTDYLGRPMRANELYDATTSRKVICGSSDPVTGLAAPCGSNPAGTVYTVRDPFPAANGYSAGTQIPSGYINAAAVDVINAFYPDSNLNVAEGALNNFEYAGDTTIKADQFGFRLDHQFSNNNIAFIRLARNKATDVPPGVFPTIIGHRIADYTQEVEVGFTHIFDPKTILNVHAAYDYTTLKNTNGNYNDPALTAAMGSQLALPVHLGNSVPFTINQSNGLSNLANGYNPLGPQENYEYNVDASKTLGRHTVSVGGMFLPVRQVTDSESGSPSFNQAGTSSNGVAAVTGFGPASFLQGIVDSYSSQILQKPLDTVTPWWAFYGQDQWQVTRKLVLTFGTRWDYVAPPDFHRSALVFDVSTGKMWAVGSVPAVATSFLPVNNPQIYQATPSYFFPKKNGWEPRVGATYQFGGSTVGHMGFGIFDQHDNQLSQGNENLALNWPNAATGLTNFSNLDIGVPRIYLNNMPTAASLFSASNPTLGYGANRNSPISYVEEYNVGIQQQLANQLVLNLDYVGSVGRHLFTDENANTSEYPGPGNTQSRAPYPQYGKFSYIEDGPPSSYNGLQAKLVRPFSSGATFTASYTWSKSMDVSSEPENGEPFPSFYNQLSAWGPSDYDIRQMLVFSGVYQLPFGKGRTFMATPNAVLQEALGDWQIAGILSLHSGLPSYAQAGTDFANTGWGFEPAMRGSLSPYSQSAGGASGLKHWLLAPTPNNGAALPTSGYAFTTPLLYTIGNERRDDLVQPDYKDVDISLSKDFPIWESVRFQFRSDFFNVFNHTNYGAFGNSLASSSNFGVISGVAGNPRLIQLSGKISF